MNRRPKHTADQAGSRLRLLAPSNDTGEPTLGAIKRALHELSRTAGAQREHGELLREAHDLLRQLALRNGIDPENALQRSRAMAQSRRERAVQVGSAGSDPALV